MTIDEMIRVYVLEPPLDLARKNRVGRTPKEDPVAVSFIEALENESVKTGMTISEFRRRFNLCIGCYPEYALGGIDLSQAMKLCRSMDLDPAAIVKKLKNGE